MFDQASSSLPLVRGGKVKTYGVTALKRLASASDIPTLHEGGMPGLPGLDTGSDCGRPGARPKDAIAKLNAAVVAALTDPAVSKRLTDLGAVLPPPEQLTPEALGTLQRSEIERWWPIIRAANIKGE